jgi:XTP/dITP diphosphohydrolase
VTRLVLLVTSPRVAPGLVSAAGWEALRAGPVFSASVADPQLLPLAAAGITVGVAETGQPPEALARDLRDAARASGTASWLVGPDGDEDLVVALAQICGPAADGGDAFEVEYVLGSWDLPGARLLDVVSTVDRLRSPGGCPWDAKQDHVSLAPYLLEEAYEAFQEIEDGDSAGLCEELGDVLFQVAFHARLAQELPEAEQWSIDDVALGLVDKLVRRHPHVFGEVAVSGAEEVKDNWESIKAAERGDASALSSVALAAPALTLAATLQRKAARAGLTPAADDEPTFAEAAASFDDSPSSETAAAMLWAAVAAMQHHDIDAEAALRGRARAFRDAAAEHETRALRQKQKR